MDEKMIIQKSTLVNIADAIREKSGIGDSIPIPDMANLIKNLGLPVYYEEFTPTVTTQSSQKTFYHNLGVVPNFLYIVDSRSEDSIIAEGSSANGSGYTVMLYLNPNTIKVGVIRRMMSNGTSATSAVSSIAYNGVDSQTDFIKFTVNTGSGVFLPNQTYKVFVTKIPFEDYL